MSRVVHLHIGAPKTGTTYLQDRLTLNLEQLARHGVTVPSQHRAADADLFHFRAALDLLGQDWGGAPGHAHGAWDSMVRKVNRADRSIISHEILSGARPDTIARALNDLADCEVHLVYSARDLGRQLPAAWQESIKQGRKWSYERFLTRYQNGRTWFRRAFDLPTVLNNWSVKLPPERVHVVTVPHERGPRGDALWQRFLTAFDLDESWLPKESERSNRSMGLPETQLLRTLNRRLDTSVHHDAGFDPLIRQLLAEKVLAHRDSVKLMLPPDRFEFAEEQAGRWIDWLHGSGVQVVGDPQDLMPRRYPVEQYADPSRKRRRAQLDAAVDALAAMTEEAMNARQQEPLGRRVLSTAARLRRR